MAKLLEDHRIFLECFNEGTYENISHTFGFTTRSEKWVKIYVGTLHKFFMGKFAINVRIL